MDKRTWKLIYSNYSGMEKKAIELVSAEMGAHLNRDKGVFSLHVFPCVNVNEITDFNAVIVGCYDTNELIRKYIDRKEIPEDGYVVKVMDNPDNEELKIMIVAALEQKNVFYGAVELVDDYFSFAAPSHGGLRMVDEIFLKHDENNMPTECIAEEIYYFLFNPKQGFAVQCLYTADGTVDEAYRVKNDELVEFPYGYHTTVSTPGYQTYFLWLMAGDYQGFNRSSDPEHAWIENR